MKWSCPRTVVWLGIALFLALSSRAPADMISITPFKDATLIESPLGLLSNGGHPGIFAGRVGSIGGGSIRRAVMAFDLTSIPAGSTISRVELRLQLLKAASGTGTRTVTLHPLLGDWGEGTASDPTGGGGGGSAALLGDVTWIDQFRGSDLWTTPGGDFVPTPSASLAVTTSLAAKTFASTAQLVADVQGWVNLPATNFGWMLRGDESVSRTARKFASRSFGNPSQRPMLTIEFTPPSGVPGDADADGDVDRDDVLLMTSHWGQSAALTADQCDFTDDGRIGISDLAVLQNHIGRSVPRAAAGHPAVPEPGSWTFVVPVVAVAAWRNRPRRRAA